MKPRIEIEEAGGWFHARVVGDGVRLVCGKFGTRKHAREVAKRFLETLAGGVVRKSPSAFRSPHPLAQRRPK